MAKSARSKWKRARNAEKRVLYAKKGLEKLKALVQRRDTRDKILKELTQVEIKTEPIEEETTKASIKKQDPKLQFNLVTLQNKLGQYPKWMKKEAIRKHKNSQKKKVYKRKF